MNSRSDVHRKSAGGGADRVRKLVYAPNAKKTWSAEDDEYLREHWGCRGGIPSIANQLGRSIEAVKNRAVDLALGPFIKGGTLVSLNVLFHIVIGDGIKGGYNFTRTRWERLGLPLHFVRINSNRFYMIDIEEFWRWAQKHQSALDFSRFEENALGKEPAWVKEKRKVDRENRRIQHYKKCPWSPEEVAILRNMLEHEATYADLERALQRSSQAIRRKIYDLYLPRPKRSKQVAWTEDDMRTLVRLTNQGYSEDYCAKAMNRSCQAVRGRKEMMRKQGLWSKYERI